MFDFEGNSTVDSLDAVPGEFQSFYGESGDGKFALRSDDPTVKNAVSTIAALGKSLSRSRQEAKDYQDRQVDLTPLSEFGSGVEEITAGVQAKLQELQEQVKGGKQAKLDLDSARADWEKGAAKKEEGYQNRIGALESQLSLILKDGEILKHATDAHSPDLLLPFARDQLKVDESDGTFKVVVVDEKGNIRFSPTTGDPMTVKELVADMRTVDRFKPLFKAEVPQGSDHKPGTSGRPGTPTSGAAKSPLNKIQSGLDAGHARPGRPTQRI